MKLTLIISAWNLTPPLAMLRSAIYVYNGIQAIMNIDVEKDIYMLTEILIQEFGL